MNLRSYSRKRRSWGTHASRTAHSALPISLLCLAACTQAADAPPEPKTNPQPTTETAAKPTPTEPKATADTDQATPATDKEKPADAKPEDEKKPDADKEKTSDKERDKEEAKDKDKEKGEGEDKDKEKSEAKSDSDLPPEKLFEGGDKAYSNWIEFSTGALLTHGSAAQAEERHRLPNSVFGGIEDLHYRKEISKGTVLTLDGRGLFDDHDYRLSFDLTRENLGFFRFNAQNSRTWYNGDAGFYAPLGVSYEYPGDTLFLDRGEISVETGITLPKTPKVTFKYTRRTREGDKSSTSWGQAHPDPAGQPAGVQGLAPSTYDLDETLDIFQLDVAHKIKATDLGLGLRYENASLDNSRRITEYPGELDSRKITDRTGTTYDLFSVHAYTETWLKKNLLFSSGALFANLDSVFTGSRIYGDDFDVGYIPGYPLGYESLNGGAHKNEYVLNFNLMSIPLKHLTLVPSVRVQKEDWNADSTGPGTQDYLTAPFTATDDRSLIDVRERLDATYKGVTNWVFRAGGEWTQGEGNLEESGGLGRVLNRPGVGPILRETEDSRRFQKYSIGARWYPARRLTLDAGGYYKLNSYDYDHTLDNTPNDSPANRYPAYLVMQDFDTYDGNFRLTFRPVPKVTLMSRYEYQWSTVKTGPDASSGLDSLDTSKLNSHIFAQNIGWTPLSRLYLQAGFNYVVSDTYTPTSDFTQAALAAQNNYWTVNFNSGLVIDNKTDLNLGYFYYQADNLEDSFASGVPLGMTAAEHGVTATLTRRLKPNLLLTLRYGFFDYDDTTFGGSRDYQAHVVSSSLRYRF
jgi:hypothetical protein